MKGFGELRKSEKRATQKGKPSQEQIINQAFKFHLEGNIPEASRYYQYCISQNFNDHRVFFNYGIILKNVRKLKEAETSYRKAIEIKPDYAEAYSNLGNILRDLGNLQEAETSYRKAIEIKPDYEQAHFNLGNALKEIGKLQEAEISYRKAIEIKPSYAAANLNLGTILIELGKLDEAELSTRRAIEIKPDYAEAYANLGTILIYLGKLDEAELATRKAIEIKPDYAEAYSTLAKIMIYLGKLDEAELATRRAIEIKPDRKTYFQYSSCLFEKRSLDEAKKILKIANSLPENENEIESSLLHAAEVSINFEGGISANQSRVNNFESSKPFNRIILNRTVESEVISYLYTLKNKKLDITRDARYGNGLCSKDFKLFQDDSKIISNLAHDIKELCREKLEKKEIIICDSFFNIFVSGCGAKKHNHIKDQDKNFNLHLRKYSLVYYLEVGDQAGKDPGILKLYEPDEEIVPTKGMIVIIDGKKKHSVEYNGKKDRVMIGANFYGF